MGTLFPQDSPLQSPHDFTHDNPLRLQEHNCVEQGFLLVHLQRINFRRFCVAIT